MWDVGLRHPILYEQVLPFQLASGLGDMMPSCPEHIPSLEKSSRHGGMLLLCGKCVRASADVAQTDGFSSAPRPDRGCCSWFFTPPPTARANPAARLVFCGRSVRKQPKVCLAFPSFSWFPVCCRRGCRFYSRLVQVVWSRKMLRLPPYLCRRPGGLRIKAEPFCCDHGMLR